jgi:hypothetical protein
LPLAVRISSSAANELRSLVDPDRQALLHRAFAAADQLS